MISTALALAALTVAPAQVAPGRTPMAAPAPEIAPAAGVTVYDGSGAVVGTIVSVAGEIAVIDTGTNKIGFPTASMAGGTNGVTIAATKAQLDADAAQRAAKAAADLNVALTAGTVVRSRNGTASVGTIAAVDAEYVTLTTVKGDVRFPRAGFSLDQQGVIIGFTADEFAKAIGAN